MSSLGNQWRMIRHYLSSSNLPAEVEKLIQKIKPATPKQWDDLIKRFEKMVSARMSSAKEITIDKLQDASGAVLKPAKVEESDTNMQVANNEAKEIKQKDVMSDVKESITVESLWQGLKLKKDLHLGKISEPTWKSNKQIITKTSIHSRTAYVVSAIESAASAESALRRTERLIDHLHEFPEARDYAIKEGAVCALLRVRGGRGGPARRRQRGAGAGGLRGAPALGRRQRAVAGRRRHPRHHRHRDPAPPGAPDGPQGARAVRLHRGREHGRHHRGRGGRRRGQPGRGAAHVPHAGARHVRQHVAHRRRLAPRLDALLLRHAGLGEDAAGQPQGPHSRALQQEQYAQAGDSVVRGERGVAADAVPVPLVLGGVPRALGVPGHVARAAVARRARVGRRAHLLRRVPAARAAAPGRRHRGQQPGRRGAARGARAVGRGRGAGGGARVAGHGPRAAAAPRLRAPRRRPARARHQLARQVQHDPRLRHRHRRRAPGAERPDPGRPLLPLQPAAHAGLRHGRDRRPQAGQPARRHRGVHQTQPAQVRARSGAAHAPALPRTTRRRRAARDRPARRGAAPLTSLPRPLPHPPRAPSHNAPPTRCASTPCAPGRCATDVTPPPSPPPAPRSLAQRAADALREHALRAGALRH